MAGFITTIPDKTCMQLDVSSRNIVHIPMVCEGLLLQPLSVNKCIAAKCKTSVNIVQ
jgi:hypothetical protein